MKNNTSKQDETNLWKVNERLLGVIEIYQKAKLEGYKIFDEIQELKRNFVKNFKEDDYRAYYEFKYSIEALEKKRNENKNILDYIEKFAKEFYCVDLFEELTVKQRIPVAED